MLNLSACIAQQVLSFTGYTLFAIRQCLVKNSTNIPILGLNTFQTVVRFVSQTLTYILYVLTNFTTTALSLVKIILIGVEWVLSTT